MGDEQILAVLNRLDIVGKLTTEIERVTTGVDGLRVRMDSRFDALAAQIHEHNTRLSLIEQRCERHDEEEERARVESERRERKISQLATKVETARESSINAVPQPTAVDVVKLLDEREEQRSKRQRQWIAWGLPLLIAALGAPQVRSCVGEERAARVEQAVQRLERRVEEPKVVKVPVPQPVPVPVNGGEK